MFLLYFLTYLKIVHIFHNILEKVKKYYANAFIVYVQFSTASLLLGPHKNVVCRTSEPGVYNYKISTCFFPDTSEPKKETTLLDP